MNIYFYCCVNFKYCIYKLLLTSWHVKTNWVDYELEKLDRTFWGKKKQRRLKLCPNLQFISIAINNLHVNLVMWAFFYFFIFIFFLELEDVRFLKSYSYILIKSGVESLITIYTCVLDDNKNKVGNTTYTSQHLWIFCLIRLFWFIILRIR